MMIPNEVIEKVESISAMLFEAGTPMDAGWQGPINDALHEKIKAITNKPYCIVKDWQWWDLSGSEEVKQMLLKRGQHPSLIYSHFVIEDELGRFMAGDNVRTSLLNSFQPPAFFETGNTLYVLVGPGTRKTVSPSDVASIFF